VGVIDRLRVLAQRKHAAREATAAEASGPTAGHMPDPARPPQARGPWEQAALTNVDITEVVKRQIGTVTPPWKK